MYEGMLAETVRIRGHEGEEINAYSARPARPRSLPGRRRDSPHAGVGRVVQRGRPQVRLPRLRGRPSRPALPRAARP